jgi:uncharacterized protein YfaA (DUF2138 family)
MMPAPSTAELQQIARDAFGRELSAAEAEAYRARLPTMARNLARLRAWERQLGETPPAQVQITLADSDNE